MGAKKKANENVTETVILKNGAEESSTLVVMTMMILNGLMDEGKAGVVYELVELCKNPDHQPLGIAGEELKNSMLAF